MGLYPLNPNVTRQIQGVNASTFLSYLKFAANYHQKPVLGSTIVPHTTLTCGASIVTVTTGLTQPDVPRNIVVTGNTGANEVIRMNGLDASGAAIYEDFTLSGATPQVGAKAFKTFVSIVTAIGSHTASFVCGSVLGLAHRLTFNSLVSKCFNGVAEAGTLAISSTVLALNTYVPVGTLDGAIYVDLLYFV